MYEDEEVRLITEDSTSFEHWTSMTLVELGISLTDSCTDNSADSVTLSERPWTWWHDRILLFSATFEAFFPGADHIVRESVFPIKSKGKAESLEFLACISPRSFRVSRRSRTHIFTVGLLPREENRR